MRNAFLILGLCLSSTMLFSSCSTPAYPLGFYMETSPEAGQMFTVKWQDKYYDKVPFMSLKDFEKFESFPAEDLASFGVVLYAKPQMKTRLEAYTGQNQDKYILPTVKGINKPIMHIGSGPIRSGRLIIWAGITPDDLKGISETLQPVNKELEEKRMNAVKIKGDDGDKRKPKVISEKRGRL